MILFFKVKNLTKHLECYRFYLTNLMKGSFYKTFFLLGMSFSLSLNAEIQHSGFLGGPFHGVSRDVSGSIVNRVGTAADLVDTIGLVAHSDLRSIEDGESAHLQAALRLDDGTITKINARDVQWSTESDKLSIADGLATARNVGKRTRVAILASTDGYSATIFVRLKPGQTPVDAVDQFELPRALANAVDLELPGWKKSDWFGSFYKGENNWIHHAQHGWLYAAGGDTTSAWLWSPKQEWLWTGPGIYPHLYRNSDASWIYFVVPALPRKIYFNHSTQIFEEEE